MSELVGGPWGTTPRRPRDRLWTPARIVIALALVVFCLHWMQKSPCQDGAWVNNKQYTHFCYTDVLALYYAEHLSEGAVPYVDHPVEYPVLTGALMGILGLPVHALGVDNPALNQGQAFYLLNALVLIGVRAGDDRRAARPAPATSVGRGDAGARAGDGGHRDGELGPVRGRADRVLSAGLGPPPAGPGRGPAGARRGGEVLPVPVRRSAARAGPAYRPVAGRRDHPGHGGG